MHLHITVWLVIGIVLDILLFIEWFIDYRPIFFAKWEIRGGDGHLLGPLLSDFIAPIPTRYLPKELRAGRGFTAFIGYVAFGLLLWIIIAIQS